MKVSVILCTYAPEMYEHFEEAAESILGQSYDDLELVIVVDGNAEVERRVKRDYVDKEDVIVHFNDENYGLLRSRNIGAKQASGDIVAFIDDDAIADERWVEELVNAYEEHGAVSVGGKMTPIWVQDRPRYLPEEFYFLIGVTHKGFRDNPGEVRNTFGSNISFLREVFLNLDGFDSQIGGRKGEANLQGGETELCARMRSEYNEGVWYNPDAIVGHKVFQYRTRYSWLIDRAFWQGYSKRAMESIVPDTGETEKEFLHRILFKHGPERLKNLILNPSFQGFLQLTNLFLLTLIVGFGYLYGILKW